MRRVLVIEADETVRRELLLALRARGIEADAVADATGGAAVLAQTDVAAVVVGPRGVVDVASILRIVRLRRPAANGVVAMVADQKAGWDAMRAGAADFVTAGPTAYEAVALALRKIDLRDTVARAAGNTPALGASAGGRNGAESAGAPDGDGANGAGSAAPLEGGAASPDPDRALARFVGKSPRVVALRAQVRRFARVASAVLIGGESGTGKELVARALHDLSPWRGGPFVPVNCGAIPVGLIESELFGHERGAFTDAVRAKPGLFQVAHKGTLFLDEIADLPLGSQAKLLRVLQDGLVRPVGATEDVRVEVRVLAASARDLASEVQAGRFRQDLYFRLAALDLQIPPLRERPEDIAELVRHFLGQTCARLGLPLRTVDPAAMGVLLGYPWPGNARELENTIERAAVLCADDHIDVASLPERVAASAHVGPGALAAAGLATWREENDAGLSIKRATREIEELLIRRALAWTGGNRVRAAELLEISHRALLYKIKDYAIKVDSAKRGAGSKTKTDAEPPPRGSRARPAG